MITEKTTREIQQLWDTYLANNKQVAKINGGYFDDINKKREAAIVELKKYLKDFLLGVSTLREFRATIDGFNKKYNFWGFTAIKGQMFFNLMTRAADNEGNIDKLTHILCKSLPEPQSLEDALSKIELLEKHLSATFVKATDKRKAANPSSISYFLSYFWQIQNHEKWAIQYTSMINAFIELGLWENPRTQKDSYAQFYHLNEEIKTLISTYNKAPVSNWDVEHTFWILKIRETSPNLVKKQVVKNSGSDTTLVEKEAIEEQSNLKEAGFNIYDFIPPITSKLIDQCNEVQIAGSLKGSKYEKTVSEIFKQLGFDVTLLGQGTGREPDLIAKSREDGVAFIIDAKAYTNGYTLSASDERAIREYISHYCPRLNRDGIKKIVFIIVSNTFREGFQNFINDITWQTDIKRFVLLQSDALLHLLAYKIKDNKSVSDIIDTLVRLEYTIRSQDIIQQFEDV